MREGRSRRIAISFISLSIAFVSAASAFGNSRGSLTVDSRERTYELHVPLSYAADKRASLVLVLHGRLGDGHGNVALTHFDKVSDAYGFLVAYPDGLNRSWADGRGGTPADKDGVDDVHFLSELIRKLSSEYRIDAARVYVTGMSNGGFMTQRVACSLADQIAAAGSVAATMGQILASSCKPSKPVPMMLIQGTQDPLVSINGGSLGTNGSRGEILSLDATAQKWVSLDGCNSKPEKTALPDVANDGTTIQRETFSACKASAEVIVYTVEGGGHTWPGGKQYLPEALIGKTSRNMDASEVLWEFFSRHSR